MIRLTQNIEHPRSTNFHYILWVGDKPVGLFSLTLNYEVGDGSEGSHEAFVYIDVLGVFILKKYRGKGLGFWLATQAGTYVRNKIINKSIRDFVSTGVHLQVHADYESDEGEAFCENLYSEINYGLSKMFAITGKSFSSSLDAGY